MNTKSGGMASVEIPISKPNPDPTEYTNDAIERSAIALRDYVNGKIETLDERLKGMDKATTLVETSTNNVPALIEKEVAHLRDFVNAEIASIRTALAVREVLRVEQKLDSTTGLAAALSAQKELAAAENSSNKLAISKSEQATNETIKTNQDANNERFAALIKTLDEVKQSVTRLETTKQAVTDTKTEARAAGNYSMGIISTVIGLILFVLGIFGTYVVTKDQPPVQPTVVTVTTP